MPTSGSKKTSKKTAVAADPVEDTSGFSEGCVNTRTYEVIHNPHDKLITVQYVCGGCDLKVKEETLVYGSPICAYCRRQMTVLK